MSSETDKAQFFLAVEENDIQQVDKLLSSKDINVDLRNPEVKNRTALHLAAHRGRYELVHLLVVKHYANVNIEDSEGDIPLQLATDRYHMKIVKFLLSKDSNRREYAARFLNTDEVEEWFQAVEENDISKVTELLNSGMDVDSEDLSNLNHTALEVAATRGYSELVRLLTERGADMYHEADTDECAYHMAANNDHDNIVNFFLENGFKDPYARDSSASSDTDVSLNYRIMKKITFND